ncbi:hypothetical protein DFR39_105199 [Roseateles asaccharophilus]|uniref:Uncharacterized protein n=2 Tax=Roseateles asaccharophilus TaxID=582607 RepID=A0A4R6N2N5_9BURK|nr:hypothetical protein DFR39_105199 [Roseateles asaccharophilus]
MQDPTIFAVLQIIYKLSPALLASVQPETVAHGNDEEFDLIDRVRSGTATAVGDALLPGDGKLTADQVESVFELFAEEIEDYLEFSMMNTCRWTLLETCEAQH